MAKGSFERHPRHFIVALANYTENKIDLDPEKKKSHFDQNLYPRS